MIHSHALSEKEIIDFLSEIKVLFHQSVALSDQPNNPIPITENSLKEVIASIKEYVHHQSTTSMKDDANPCEQLYLSLDLLRTLIFMKLKEAVLPQKNSSISTACTTAYTKVRSYPHTWKRVRYWRCVVHSRDFTMEVASTKTTGIVDFLLTGRWWPSNEKRCATDGGNGY